MLGRFLLFEKKAPFPVCNSILDDSVKHITDFELLKDNKLGILQVNFERLRQQNTDLFVCFEGNMPVGMIWGHRGSCYVKSLGIPFIQKDDSIYLFWVYTLPEARCKNVFKRLINAFFTHYSDAKIITAVVESKNVAMRNLMIKLGFEEINRYNLIKVGEKTLYFIKNVKTQKIHILLEKGNKNDLLSI
jgi:ribosomal protein S18 acetylase RimI-like enzyme